MLRRSLILNLLIALLLVAGLAYGFFNSLNYLTNHGKEISVPKLTGKSLNQVVKELRDKKFKVQIDSTYKSYIDPLQILRQEPEEGSMVKVGRTIFLLVNRADAPKLEMPDLVSKSFRNAVLILKSYRFVMGDTIYRPDIAAGAVLEQRYNGKVISAGSPVPYGSRIDLVVGEGLADYEVDVPNLVGKSWRDAKDILASAGLFELLVYDGEIEDTMSAIVYKQYPEALNDLDFPNAIRGGDMIDLHLMQNPTPQILRKNAPGSLKYQDLDDSTTNVLQQRLDNANTTLAKAKKKTVEPVDQDLGFSSEEDNTVVKPRRKRRKVQKEGKGLNALSDSKKKKKKKKKKAAPKPKKVIQETNDQDFSNEFE
jgi:beta-lactam-binding protein with PASTA domain